MTNPLSSIYDIIIEAIGRDIGSDDELSFVKQRFERILAYNVPKGKGNRALFVNKSFKLMAQYMNRTVTDKEIELSMIMGAVLEILHTSALMYDDYMDKSITRRGNLCWYRQDSTGAQVLNDTKILMNGCMYIIKLYFGTKSYYTQIIDLFHEIMRQSTYGQCMDMLSKPPNMLRPQFHLFTKSRYETIVKFKTSYYTFVLPVRLGMYMMDMTDQTVHQQTEQLLLKIGYLFQIQDDFIDCFGDPVVTGKIGTDIADGKCCWLIVTALELCNKQQLDQLMANYAFHYM
ncbi:farnesyl pyrophosphate synthase-like [Oppia nitens]|uniref:farnesyl pyrophosphate synthase-like n=1 Tax=Oppia nitens TaxID=1686743 RepID=UPI0023DBF10B|nr:farnesyl pyrophosphate synthase-like [Oppia nitens]